MRKTIDLTGEKIGKLTLLKRKREDNRTYYYCKCDCGSDPFWVRSDSLKGNTVSCGCVAKENRFKSKDIAGQKFGRLTAIKPTNRKDKSTKGVVWECKCDCGKLTYVVVGKLTTHKVESCGCLREETYKNNIEKAIKKHLEEHIVEGTNIPAISRNKPLSSNTSGYTGVRWDKSRNKWGAYIEFKKKIYYLGRYENKEDAIKIRKQAEEKLFGEFLEWYNKEFKKEKL